MQYVTLAVGLEFSCPSGYPSSLAHVMHASEAQDRALNGAGLGTQPVRMRMRTRGSAVRCFCTATVGGCLAEMGDGASASGGTCKTIFCTYQLSDTRTFSYTACTDF